MPIEQVNANKHIFSHVTFTTAGLCAILLFLLWNPLVLRPRLWSATVVVRSRLIDAALRLIGVGLIRLRRWAALLASAVAIYVATDFASSESGLGVALTLILLTPLLLTVVFWRDLVWGDKRHDLLLAIACLVVSGLFHCSAYLIHHA